MGDVILSVANQPVNSSADVHNAIAQAEKIGKRDVLMRIKTENDRIEFVALPLPAQEPSLWGRIQSWIRSRSNPPRQTYVGACLLIGSTWKVRRRQNDRQFAKNIICHCTNSAAAHDEGAWRKCAVKGPILRGIRGKLSPGRRSP